METNNEITDISQPQVIEHFVGQEKVKALVKTALEASWMDNSRFPNTLALGGPGLGKTQIAQIISKELGTVCKETLASNFSSISNLNGFLMDSKDGDVLFLDEIHTIKKDLMVSLYRAMENNKIFHKKLDGKIIAIDLPHFTLIGGTTDFHLLPKPLIDRFKLVLNFDFYSEVEIEQIITNRCKKVGWNIQEQVLSEIGKIARGIPRIALKILENTRRVSRAEGSDIITIEHLTKSCDLEGLDKLGLNDNERKLLQILASENKPLRLNTLGMMMGTIARNISENYEPYLYRIGFISKDDKGRFITEKGKEYIKNIV